MLDTVAIQRLMALRERDHAQGLLLITEARKLCTSGSFDAAVKQLRELSRLLSGHCDAASRAIEALVEAGRCPPIIARRFTDNHVALKVLAYDTEQAVASENQDAALTALQGLSSAIEAHEAEELRELMPLLFFSFEVGSARREALN